MILDVKQATGRDFFELVATNVRVQTGTVFLIDRPLAYGTSGGPIIDEENSICVGLASSVIRGQFTVVVPGKFIRETILQAKESGQGPQGSLKEEPDVGTDGTH